MGDPKRQILRNFRSNSIDARKNCSRPMMSKDLSVCLCLLYVSFVAKH